MKSISFYLLLAVSFFMASCGSSKNATAQSSTQTNTDISAEEMAEKQTAQMVERLNLTPEQETTISAVNLRYAQEMKTIAQQGRSISTMRDMRAMNQRKTAEMEVLLSEEQFVEYEKMVEEMKAQLRSRRRG